MKRYIERCHQAVAKAREKGLDARNLRWLMLESAATQMARHYAQMGAEYTPTEQTVPQFLGHPIVVYPDHAWGELFGYPIVLQCKDYYLGVNSVDIDQIQII